MKPPTSKGNPDALDLLTVAHTAGKLHCSPRWVRELIAAGKLPAVRLRDGSRLLIRRADVLALLEVVQ